MNKSVTKATWKRRGGFEMSKRFGRQTELKTIAEILTETCRTVDPTSTEETIKKAHAVADVVAGEENAKAATVSELEPVTNADDTSDFGVGILD